jgi:molybdenum cofactor cytidylyltransferase
MRRASDLPAGSRKTSSDDSARIAGIVLAAGASRRMGGTNKLLLEIEVEPMIRLIVRRAIAASLDPVLVVTGYESERVRGALEGLTCTFVENPDFTGPTSTSLHAALRSLKSSVSAAVIMLGDMVGVTTPMIAAIADEARRSTAAPLVVSRYGDEQVFAPPVLFRRELWPELLAWTGEGCGKAVVMAHLREAIPIDWPAASLHDVDTPSDYESVR